MRRTAPTLASRWLRPRVDVLQFRFPDGGELSGHALANLLLSEVWEKTSDPVAGLDELLGLLECGGRVLPCCVDPLGDSRVYSRTRWATSRAGQRGSGASGGCDNSGARAAGVGGALGGQGVPTGHGGNRSG